MSNITGRKIKVLRFTLRHGLQEVEEKVNQACEELSNDGNKIVNIYTYVVHSSPVYVVYNLVYEPMTGR